MSLSVGIVGLPNAGKSTLFNALAARRLAQTATHPFTTITSCEAVVPVPDEKLNRLADLVKPEKTTPATTVFVDIAGLVRNAHKGEGLGNQFLAKIREVDAIVHVVRAFENPTVSHIYGRIDPKEDIEIVNLELELAGIVGKPVIYVLNVDEAMVRKFQDSNDFQAVADGPVIVIPAKLEEELGDLTEEERMEYYDELGIKESGLEKLVKEAYRLLGLITFYTIKGGKEVRAWSIKKGSSVLDAAAEVHTDFAKNFVKAEVIGVDELLALKGWKIAREKGMIRLEGRDYLVQDRDVIEFRVSS